MTLAEKRELAARLLRERAAKLERTSPASYVQRSLWLHHRMDPLSAAYNVSYALRIRSLVDRGALHRALQALTDRHESLRTTFQVETGDELPVQRVRGHVAVSFEAVPLPGLSDEAMRRRVQDAIRTPFQLETGPLFRAHLLEESPAGSVLLITAHHSVMDGWSLILLLDELRQIYAAERDGSVVQLGPIEARYSDFVRWQQELVAGAEGKRLRTFWTDALTGELPVLDLPADRPRPPVQTSNGATQRFELPASLHNGLRALAKSEGATMFGLLLASWMVLLHRHSRQPEIIVGVPAAGRSRKEFERLSGCFINMVAIRSDLSANPPFHELLAQVRQQSSAALANADYPFQLLVEELGCVRDPSRSPVFQNSFGYQNLQRAAGLMELFERHAQGHQADFGGLATEPFPIDQQEGQIDISIELLETNSTLNGICRYNADLFDAANIQRLLVHFQVLLESIVSDPRRPVSSIPLLTDPEYRQLTHEWPGVAVRGDWDYQSFPALVDEWAARTPDVVALESEAEKVTYRELAQSTNALAAGFRERGVGPETLVGIAIDRSPRAIIAILAILKAGGAYLPLDAAFPPDRLEFMLSDSGAALVITERKVIDSLPPGPYTALLLDDLDLSHSAAPPFRYELPPDQLAYVIYTSGSTGKPKGAELTHRGLSDVALGGPASFGLAPRSRVLQFATLSFDASLLEITLALATGGTLVLADRERLLPGPELAGSLRSLAISATFLSPSILAATPQIDLPDLKLLLTGGEECSAELVARWSSGRRFFNLYGPTEASVWMTFAECSIAPGKPPIGRPRPNTTVYLLDDAMQPVPCGVAGELYIGGDCVGRGYRNRSELTRERFVADPFCPGGRLYRSGDLARWRPDGALEFVGRADQQVKLRGYRIELGEIEALLRELPGVRDAVVITRGSQLAAYVVPSESSVDADNVIAHLRTRLPDYMRPASLTVLPAFPLAPTGKVDRRSLPEPSTAAGYTAPRNATEAALCECFAEALRHSPYGIHDDFFAHGGHSLIATQLLARLREVIPEEVTLRLLFENPTPAQLAARISGNASAHSALPSLQAGRRDTPPELSFAQERLWFLHQLEPLSPAFNIPAAVRIHGRLDIPAVERAIGHIIHRHDVLRARFPTVDGLATQQIQEPGAFALQQLDGPVTDLASGEAFRPFRLASQSPIRACIIREDETSHVLLITMHHIVSDGWSMGVFLREFGTLYQHFRGDGPQLEPLSIQYRDYAAWQRSWLSGDILDAQLTWWKAQLKGITAAELPATGTRSSTHSGKAGTCHIRIDAAAVDRLKQISRTEGATLYMTLLALFHDLLGRYTASDDVVCGSPVANRNHPETQHLIGFFVNMLVMRGDLAGDPSLRQMLSRERPFTLGALANQDIPFEVLVDQLQPQRDLSRPPLFQNTFALHNVPLRMPVIPGLRLQPLEDTARTARYDVEFHLSESDDGSIEGFALYASDLFDSSFIRTFVQHYQALASAAAAKPDAPLRALNIMSEPERSAVLALGNALSEGPVYEVDCLHRMVEGQAARLPLSPAVRYEGNLWTYSDLDAHANRIANLLGELGVKRGSFVGLFLDRSLDLIVGMLGILKAGAAYVPMDPVYPRERLHFMASDAGLAVILTQASLRDRLEGSGAATICLDADKSTIDAHPPTPPASGVQPSDVAYVIYTSGSTGRPKGVLVTHANVSRIFAATREWFGFNERDIWTMFHSSAFDFSVWEIWGALVHGGCLVVVPYAISRSPEAFHQLLLDENVTVLNQTPSAFRQLQHVALASERSSLALRLVIFGGEALDYRSLAPWFARFGDKKPWLVNMYGITETTIHVTFRPVTEADARQNISFIGRPLPDLQLYVLDPRQRLVPSGVAGELCVGGAGVSLGYLNRPELTSEKFIENPFRPGEKLYRSGDSGRITPQGDIEYLGRLDHQVQLHGFRIELGEIEAALTSSPQVRDAVAQMRNERIIAWIVPAADGEINVSALRSHLRERLPDYMLPSVFVPLAAVPLNANGKVDARALPDPGTDRPELESDFATPRTSSERVLAEIWSEVLGIERVGIHDNFFELGGDSILSIRIVSKAAAAGLKITPKLLFQNQTVAQLAGVATEVDAKTEAEQGAVVGTAPLSPIQRWFVGQDLPDAHHWNQSAVLALTQEIGSLTLEQAFRRLFEHHDALRIRLRDSETIEFAPPDDQSHFSHFDLSGSADAEAEFLRLSSQLQASLDLRSGPIARFARFHFGGEARDRLLLIVHHLAVDGVSWRILLEDLSALCAQQSLPPKTAPYRDWANLTSQLPDYLAPRPPEENTEASSETISVSLSVEDTRDLLLRVPLIADCRVEDVLLASLLTVIGPSTVTVEHHGRDAVEIDGSRTVGWFTELRPRTYQPPTRSADALLEYIVQQAAGKQPPLESPEISFNYLGQFDETISANAPFTLTTLRAGSERSPRATRAHRFDVSAAVFSGRLHLNWTFSSKLDARAGMERRAQAFLEAVGSFINQWARVSVPPGAIDVYRLAPQQQGMLLESLVSRDRTVHVEQLTCVLDGPLDPFRFQDAWRAVVAKHPALRTCFAWRNRTKPVQVVFEDVELAFETGVWDSDQIEEYLESERRRGFELDRAPLMRLALFQIGDHRHRFVWTQHHSILDGWCQPLLLGEVLRWYRHGAADGSAPRYRDYVGYLGRTDKQAAGLFWRTYLDGFKQPTEVGRLAPAAADNAGLGYETVEVSLGADVTRRLEAAALANRISLGTAVLGSWALLLSRYSGSSDVLFGMTVAGRPPELPGSEQMVGLLANTLPCRTAVPREDLLWTWMRRLAEAQAEMRTYETTSPVVIRGASQVAAALPLHDSVLAFENYPVDALERDSSGLEFAIRDVSFCGARTQQAVAIIAVPGSELSMRFVFERQRITPGSMPQDFCELLAAIAKADGTATVADLLDRVSPAAFPLYHPPARTLAPAQGSHQMSGIESRLAQIWCELLSVTSAGIHDNFFDAGGHSLIAVDLMTRIRQEFGRDLPLSALIEAPTIALLAQRIGAEDGARRSPLIAITPGGDRQPLVLLPGAGGNVLYFQPLAQYLGPQQPVYAIEASGLDGREDIIADVEEIAAANIAALLERFPTGPYMLGGHSFGCMVSLEMALQLQRKGHVVSTLVILDDMAPVPGRIAPADLHVDIDAIWLYKILVLAGRLQRRAVTIPLEELLTLTPDAQLDAAMKFLKDIDYLPPSLERHAAHRYVQIFKTNFRASFRYVAKERFTGRLLLFRAANPQPEDPIVAYSRNYIDDPAWGWGKLAGQVEVRWVPGDHISMMAEPNVSQLSAAIGDSLRAATLSSGAGRA